uniref:Uncharacterized protein LOC116953440 n=1 Tax=Petromyzon marinus TaxID=7757 RepID=A0AAJ7XCR2_PETMA|nr:uncharacterized protein LOC116953440 [Petromyzon marinus]
MDTQRTNRSQEPVTEDDSVGAVGGEPEDLTEDPGTAQQPQQMEDWPPMGDSLWAAHSRLVELLYAAAATLEEINRAGLWAPRQQGGERRATAISATELPPDFGLAAMTMSAAVIGESQHHVDTGGQSPVVTSSLTDAHCQSQPVVATSSPVRPPMGTPMHSDDVRNGGDCARRHPEGEQTFQRLPVFKEFVSDGGDWGAFERRFLAHQMSGWTDDEALHALPATLDDDAHTTLTTAPKAARTMLQSALRVLTTVYGPLSDCRQAFYEWRRGQKESPLAYRMAVLALAKAAFPRIDGEGVDAMVTEKKLLALAQELQIVIVAADDADMCSLRAAKCIHAHLLSRRRPPLVPNGAAAVCAGTPTPTPPTEEVFAAGRPTEWRSGGRTDPPSSGRQEQAKASGVLITCYNVAAGCRAPRQRRPGPQPDSAPAYPPPHLTPVPRG